MGKAAKAARKVERAKLFGNPPPANEAPKKKRKTTEGEMAETVNTPAKKAPRPDKKARREAALQKAEGETKTAETVYTPATKAPRLDKKARREAALKKVAKEAAEDPAKNAKTKSQMGASPVQEATGDKKKKKKKNRRPKKVGGGGGERYVCFVGNLPFDVTSEMLKEHFASAGNVKIRMQIDKKTDKPKGCAFIELADADAQARALQLHSAILDTGYTQRHLNVELSGGSAKDETAKREREEAKRLRREAASAPRYIVFVGNLPYDATVEMVHGHFESAGAIKEVRLQTDKETGKPKGFAFVELANADAQARALLLHETELNTGYSQRYINVELPGARDAATAINESDW